MPEEGADKSKKKGFFSRLFSGLTKSRNNIGSGIERAFTSYDRIDEDFYEDLEETMIMGDIGIKATDQIMEKLRAQVKEQKIKDPGLCKGLLIHNIKEQMAVDAHAYDFEQGPSVVLVIGVNGVGKTTSVGRLHNKKNLMAELGKIDRIISREWPECMRENLIVLDGTTGQNALAQAKEFNEAAHLTGIILTKMDGTAKGGIAIAIQSELGIPVKFIGVGEKMDDLQRFRPDDYVDALFGVGESQT